MKDKSMVKILAPFQHIDRRNLSSKSGDAICTDKITQKYRVVCSFSALSPC